MYLSKLDPETKNPTKKSRNSNIQIFAFITTANSILRQPIVHKLQCLGAAKSSKLDYI